MHARSLLGKKSCIFSAENVCRTSIALLNVHF